MQMLDIFLSACCAEPIRSIEVLVISDLDRGRHAFGNPAIRPKANTKHAKCIQCKFLVLPPFFFLPDSSRLSVLLSTLLELLLLLSVSLCVVVVFLAGSTRMGGMNERMDRTVE